MVDEPRVLGQDAGTFVVPDDFDAPLPDDLLEAFETGAVYPTEAD